MDLFNGLKHAMRAAAVCAAVAPAAAQDSVTESGVRTLGEAGEPQAEFGFRQGSFFAAPIPSLDPTFGTGLTLIGGYLFKADAASSNSFIGLGFYGTDQGSRGYGVAADLSFWDNRLKAKGLFGAVDLNYDLLFLGGPIPINQSGEAASLELLYGATPKISAGLGLRYISTTITGTGASGLPPELTPDLTMTIRSAGLIAAYDTRDDTFYPTNGENLRLTLYQNDVRGEDRAYPKTVIKLDGFRSLTERIVLGGRLAGCRTTSDAPFFDACAIGAVDGLRGFSVTENVGAGLASAQASLRGRIGNRLGYEVFAGAGRVVDPVGSAGAAEIRYAGGVGLRYRLTRKFPLDFAVDATVNDAEESFIYIRVGQAF